EPVRIQVAPYDIAAWADFPCLGQAGARNINRNEFTPAQQIAAMPFKWTRRDCAIAVTTYDVASVVDAHSATAGCIGDNQRCVSVLVQQVSMVAIGSAVEPDDVAARVDPVRIGPGSVGHIDRCENTALEQKPMVPGGVIVFPEIPVAVRCHVTA